MSGGALVELGLDEIGDHFGRYRLQSPTAEKAMARCVVTGRSRRWCSACGRACTMLIDGFKRLGVARASGDMSSLVARVMKVNDTAAKAAMYGLNRVGGRTSELEEAWIVFARVREDGLPQIEVAELLGRHPTSVCRRLALIEQLGEQAKEELSEWDS